MRELLKAKKKIRKSKKPWLIIITGVPATGKSTLAIQLAAKLDWKIALGADEIKAIMKKYDKNKYLRTSSHNAWKLLGERNKRNILEGFKRYSLALKPGVDIVIKKSKKTGENLIIEGVHLVPRLYREISGFNKLFIVVKSDFSYGHLDRIKNKVFERHNKQPDVWSDKMEIFSMMENKFFQQRSNSNDLFIGLEGTANQIKKIIKYIQNYEVI
jgi:2-phosphoglycerate kinase